MAIGNAVQRGSLVYVYDENGRRLTSLLAGKAVHEWPHLIAASIWLEKAEHWPSAASRGPALS